MNAEYLENGAEMVAKNIVKSDEIYDYSDDRLQEVYDELFNLANLHLKTKGAALKFPSSYVYYRTDFSTNARATTGPGYKYIRINQGAIENMFNFFESQTDILQKEEYQSIILLEGRTKNETYITNLILVR